MLRVALAGLPLMLMACGGVPELNGSAKLGCDPSDPPTRTISCVVDFEPGPGAGFGQDRFPEIVYGDPVGGGDFQGGTDVLSLGRGGTIVFGFGGNAIVDGDGVDLLIFENAFNVGGAKDKPFADLGEVALSEDGTSWVPFPCHKDHYPFDGCAGWHPVSANDAVGTSPFDPAVAGGDGFDLKDVGLSRARFVRIRDLGVSEAPPNAGFDLDAASVLHGSSRLP